MKRDFHYNDYASDGEFLKDLFSIPQNVRGQIKCCFSVEIPSRGILPV